MSALLDPLAPAGPAPPPPPRPAPVLDLAPYPFGAARALERELGVSSVLAQVLARRGLTDPAEAGAWLRADERHDPRELAGMEEAVALVRRHVETRTRITVHGDYDVDGVCSTAILVRALRALGADVDWHLPSRLDDGYGLSRATVERLAARGTRLLLTADCAITAVEEVALAHTLGLDVLVTDHHTPRADGALPDAPLVHPALGGYPCADLCAAGVVHKLVEALGGSELAEEDLDLVALATVCDVVALRGENRRLVRAGLRAMAAGRRPGLRALLAVAKVDPGSLDASSLGFRLGPRINAAGRLHRADAGVELLLTPDPERAREIALELDAANGERRAVEQRIRWEAEAQVAALGDRPAYVLWGEDWHPGVVGIVAARIAERFHRPAVLVALPVEAAAGQAGRPEGTEGSGSGRSIPAFDLLGGLDACAGHLLRHGGHRAAAGLTIAPGELESFRAAFEEHARGVLAPEDLVPRRRVDAVVPGGELGLALAEDLARLEPCGQGNPAPLLLLPAARCADPRPMGEGGDHLRFTVEAGGARARAVLFRCGGALPVPAGEPADLVVSLETREWNGAVEPRLLLRGAHPPAPGPIEVLGEPREEEWLAAALAAACHHTEPLGRDRERGGDTGASRREVVDRRGVGPAGVLADLVRTAEPVLAVVADVPRRLPGLAAHLGGYAVCSWRTLAADPCAARRFTHVVALDPPATAGPSVPGPGWMHLAWGAEEAAFAVRVHEADHDLRPALAELYRALRAAAGGQLRGPALVSALAGAGAHPRIPGTAGRLVRVLEELGLAVLDADGPALRLAGDARTDLERSPTARAAREALETGRRRLEGSAA